MQTRIIAGVAGALAGASLTPVVNGFGLTSPFGFFACAFTGFILGWVASLLLDVFRQGA